MKNICIPKNKYTYWGLDILFFLIGCLACHYLSFFFDISAVASSCIVGLVGSFIYYRYSNIQLAIYAGSFAGMSSPSTISSLYFFLIIGFLGGSFLSLFRGCAIGIGGKLGASAFLAVMTFLIGMKIL